jgi:hypothetical protein
LFKNENTAQLTLAESVMEDQGSHIGTVDDDDDEGNTAPQPLFMQATLKRNRSSILQTAKVKVPATYTTGTRAIMALRSEPSNASHSIRSAEKTVAEVRSSLAESMLQRRYFAANSHHKTENPDVILFLECARRNVIPFVARDLTLSSSGSKHMHISHLNLIADMNNSQSDDESSVGLYENNIISINLANKGIGNDKGVCLSMALQYCPELVSIDISDNRLTGNSLASILTSVVANTRCQHINISDNVANDKSVGILSEILMVSFEFFLVMQLLAALENFVP